MMRILRLRIIALVGSFKSVFNVLDKWYLTIRELFQFAHRKDEWKEITVCPNAGCGKEIAPDAYPAGGVPNTFPHKVAEQNLI